MNVSNPQNVFIGLSDEQEASMIAEVALSVVRDRAVSSLYGYYADKSGFYPSADDVFKKPYSDRMKMQLLRCNKGALNVPLYSGAGELLGQLSRLFLVCNERKPLKEFLYSASIKAANTGIKFSHCKREKCLVHLRNAVMHCRYELKIDSDSFEKTRIVFRDENREGVNTGELILTSSQIEQIIDILINDVCFAYLRDTGWILD